MSTDFDLPAYLARIGLEASPEPTAEGLAQHLEKAA